MSTPAQTQAFLDAIGGMSRSAFVRSWPFDVRCRNTLIQDQRGINDRVPKLVVEGAGYARVLWLELRETVDLTPWLFGIDWVILSGSPDSPTDLAWLRRVIADCRAAGVPVWLRDIGACFWAHEGGTNIKIHRESPSDRTRWPDDLRDVRQVPTCLLEGE